MIILTVIAALSICLLSLSGAVFWLVKPSVLKNVLPYGVALSVGILLSNSFIHLIPEAIEMTGSAEHVSLLTLAGILLFFFIEKGMRWKHHHHVYIQSLKTHTGQQVTHLGTMNWAGDFIHNFTDGVLIAGSFAVSPQLGVVTTIAIAVHEIPQEISDTGALLYSGYSLKQSLLFNFAGSLSCLLGAVFMLLVGPLFPGSVAYLLPVTAGAFIYIAVRDMMPELQGEFPLRAHVGQIAALLAGWLIMLATGHIEHLIG